MLETKTIGDLPAAGAIDGAELIEVEQAAASRKISADIPRVDDLDAMVALVPGTDQIRISQGADDHKRMTIDAFLIASGISSFAQAIDMSAAAFDQVSTAKKQVYTITTGAGSNLFNALSIADLDGCRVRCVKGDTGAGVATIDLDGAETFLGGATSFPLRKQGDFIEFEVVGGLAIVIDSLSTIDSLALAVNQIQTLPHGCAVRLRTVISYLVCTSTDANFAVGDELERQPNYSDGTNLRRIGVSSDATNIFTNCGAAVLVVMDKTGAGTGTAITMNKWIIRARYKL